jgi:CheY-like chemotaxis protein
MPVSVELSAVGIIAGQWVPMRTESLDRNGMFLIAKDYVRPRAIFEILLHVPGRESPIYAMMTASLVERTWDGFGIEAQISCIARDDQQLLHKIYRQAMARSTPGYCESIHPAAARRARYVLVMKHALSSLVIDAMLEQGIEVEVTATAQQALKIAARGGVDLVVGSLLDSYYDGLELCRSLAELCCPPRSLLITDRGTASDFESCLYAGATKAIASPCSQALLVARIADLLRSDQYLNPEADSLPEIDDLEPARPRRGRQSLLAAMSGYVSEQLHGVRLQVRTFLRSSTFERIAAFTF